MSWVRLLLFAATVGAGCSDSFSTESVDIPIGQSRQELGVTIRFVSVVSDNRCPEEAVCAIAGAVLVHLEISTETESLSRELATMRDRNEVTVSGRRVMLVDVLPHPSLVRTTDPGSYVARLTIETRTP